MANEGRFRADVRLIETLLVIIVLIMVFVVFSFIYRGRIISNLTSNTLSYIPGNSIPLGFDEAEKETAIGILQTLVNTYTASSSSSNTFFAVYATNNSDYIVTHVIQDNLFNIHELIDGMQTNEFRVGEDGNVYKLNNNSYRRASNDEASSITKIAADLDLSNYGDFFDKVSLENTVQSVGRPMFNRELGDSEFQENLSYYIRELKKDEEANTYKLEVLFSSQLCLNEFVETEIVKNVMMEQGRCSDGADIISDQWEFNSEGSILYHSFGSVFEDGYIVSYKNTY